MSSSCISGKVGPAVAAKPGRGQQGDRSVETLLDQLENSVPQSQDKYGGYPV